jgi:hypothetical protein
LAIIFALRRLRCNREVLGRELEVKVGINPMILLDHTPI